MHAQLAALADPARWGVIGVLARRPRSVGVVAQLTGLRQPQATKHLQTLDRAGIVTSQRSAQRRIYALEPRPLRELARVLNELADTVDENRGDRDAFDQYFATVATETLAADRERWADERVFTFRRTLAVPRETVWRYVTDAQLLAVWWTPNDLKVSELVFEGRPGAGIVQEYRDADDVDESDGVVGRAEGMVDDIRQPEYLAFRLSPLTPTGGIAFTGHYQLTLREEGTATVLDVRLRITDSVVASAEFVAGIELGWNQALNNLAASIAASVSPSPATTKE